MIDSTGPKISSCATVASGATSASTVGRDEVAAVRHRGVRPAGDHPRALGHGGAM